ncbi:MAG: aminodeoxychorismate synthase component I, partial [Anoxybacillus ayderensis]|nr:aminodeoxychorismate synthase component I [Anoxybacillus ayderensis]
MSQQKRRPMMKKISYAQRDWFLQYKALSRKQLHHVLLESGRDGRYSIIGLQPFA